MKFSLLLLLLLVVSCAKKSSTSDNDSPIVKPLEKKNIEMPEVKYPAAIVFQLAEGSFSALTNPIWKVYLCLKKTNVAVRGEYVFDFNSLGGPPIIREEVSYKTSRISRKLELEKVTLKYNYKSTLVGPPEENYGYAYGLASFKTTSNLHKWKLLSGSPVQGIEKSLNIGVFNQNQRKGSLHNQSFTMIGDDLVIKSHLERFSLDTKTGKLHLIEPCENGESDVIIQRGGEID